MENPGSPFVLAFVALLVAVAAAHIDRLGEEAVFDLFYPK